MYQGPVAVNKVYVRLTEKFDIGTQNGVSYLISILFILLVLLF
jgi:hypothetical protein